MINRMNKPIAVLIVLALVGCEPRVAVQPEPAPVQSPPVAAEPVVTVPQEQTLPTITGRVIKIVDGDTADILQADKTTKRIRLASFDAPERPAIWEQRA